MTSGPISEVGLAFGSVSGNKPGNAPAGKDSNDSFAKTMQGISGSQSNQNQQSTMQISQKQQEQKAADKKDASKPENTSTDQTAEKQPAETKNKVTDEKKEQVKDTGETSDSADVHKTDAAEETDTVDEDAIDAVLSAAEEMVKNVAEELDVSEEDVKAAMETLGLGFASILNPEQLNQIVAQVTGEDMVNLVADEALYTDLQNLSGELQDTLQGLSEELGMSEEELQGFLDKMKETMSEETPVTVKEPVTPQEMSKQEEVPFLTRQESQNVIDFQKPLSDNAEDTKPTIQAADTQDVNMAGAKQTTETSQNAAGEEQSAEDTTQEQTSGNLAGYQNRFDNTVTAEAAVEEPVYRAPDTESMIEQLTEYMKTKVSEGITEMEMQLHPASLGTINLQIASKAGAITAQFAVQNEEVKQAMEAQIVQLKETLEEQGVKIEAVEVTLASHSFERNAGEQNQDQNDAYEEEKNKIKPMRRRILNLDDYANLDDFSGEEDDAARIAMEMMAGSGNRLDMLA